MVSPGLRGSKAKSSLSLWRIQEREGADVKMAGQRGISVLHCMINECARDDCGDTAIPFGIDDTVQLCNVHCQLFSARNLENMWTIDRRTMNALDPSDDLKS
jgi:hypothetical protein